MSVWIKKLEDAYVIVEKDVMNYPTTEAPFEKRLAEANGDNSYFW